MRGGVLFYDKGMIFLSAPRTSRRARSRRRAHCDGRVSLRPHASSSDPPGHARAPRAQEATPPRLERAGAFGDANQPAPPLRARDASPARRRLGRRASERRDPARFSRPGSARERLARAGASGVRRRARRARHHHPVARGGVLRPAVRRQTRGTPLPASPDPGGGSGFAHGPARARGADARELGGVPGVPLRAAVAGAGVSRPGGLRVSSHDLRRARRRRRRRSERDTTRRTRNDATITVHV